MQIVVFAIQLLAALLSLWLGIYVMARAEMLRRTQSWASWQRGYLVGLAVIFGGIYVLGIALEGTATSADEFLRWQQLTWWSAPYAITYMYLGVVHVENLLAATHREQIVPQWGIFVALFVLSILLSVGLFLGWFSLSDQVMRNALAGNAYFTPPRFPQYWFYAIYMFGVILATNLQLAIQWRRSRTEEETTRTSFPVLWAASFLILIGAVMGIIGVPGVRQVMPRDAGMIGVVLGAGFTAIAVARYQAFQLNHSLVRDFLHSLFRILLTLLAFFAVYIGLVWLAGGRVQYVHVAALGVAVVVLRSVRSWDVRLADRLLLPRWVAGYRQDLSQLSDLPIPAEQGDNLFEEAESALSRTRQRAEVERLREMLTNEIGRIFQYRRFADDEVMRSSPLHKLRCVEDALCADGSVPVDGAQALRDFLAAQIAELLQSHDGDRLSTSFIGLTILQRQYVLGCSRPQTENHLHETLGVSIAGGAYSRSLGEGRRCLVEDVVRLEFGMG